LVKFSFLLSKPGSFDPKTILIAAGNPTANTHTNLPTFCGFPHQTTSRHFLWVTMPIKSKHMLVKVPKQSIYKETHFFFKAIFIAYPLVN